MNFPTPRTVTLLLIVAITLVLGSKVVLVTIDYIANKDNDSNSASASLIKCGIDNELLESLKSQYANKFVLTVIGDGVRDKTMAKARPYSSNYAQGWDLYEGVALAAKSKTFEAISKYVEIVYIDDGGDQLCAELISQEIVKSPKVIGVIGHATSGTTKAALRNYRQANIPVIMPVATNPSLVRNCDNCFRLPSNDTIQARAIADFAVNILKGENIYLVWDQSPAASEYSDYLQNEINNLISSKIKFNQHISYRPLNYDLLLKSISLNDVDVLIFCGYGSMAREFFNGLRFEYLKKEQDFASAKVPIETTNASGIKRPKVILSDGSKISDIKEIHSKFGFESYLAFPSEKFKTKSQFNDYAPEDPPKGQEKMKLEESYEIFGHDALILFSLAFNRLISKNDISRANLNEMLKVSTTSSDLSYDYRFDNAENTLSRYFIYDLSDDSIKKKYEATYLQSVFTETPTAELVEKYGPLTLEDEKVKLDALAARLALDPKSQGLITTPFTQSSERDLRAKAILDYLTLAANIEPKRIQFAVSNTESTITELWFIPGGAQFPPLSPSLQNGQDLLSEILSRNNRNSNTFALPGSTRTPLTVQRPTNAK